MTIRLHDGDLPATAQFGQSVAIDTETMGLKPHRDRLCVVQLSAGDGSADVVRIRPGQREAPNLAALLADRKVLKIFHFARFDLAVLSHAFGVMAGPVWCTKIASKLVRTYTDRHGLKDLVRELLGVDMSKQQQSSDWGAAQLSDEQLRYAASDVLYLHRIKARLDEMLARRRVIAERYLDYLGNHPLFRPPATPEGLETNWQSFQIGVRDGAPVARDEVMEKLHALGVPTRRGVMASHLEAPYRDRGAALPNTEHAFASNLQLPIHPAMDMAQVDRVIEALGQVTREADGG